MKLAVLFKICSTFIRKPPRRASTYTLVIKQILLCEIVEPFSRTSIREVEYIRDFNCREEGLSRVLKILQNLGIRDCFFPPSHYIPVYIGGSYHHRLGSNHERTGFTCVLSFVERTKSFTETIQKYGSNLADPSLLDGSILKIERTPLVGQRARVGFREVGTKAMYDDTPRGLESLATTVAPFTHYPLFSTDAEPLAAKGGSTDE